MPLRFPRSLPADQLAILNDMHSNWPFFQGTIDLIEMVLAKADPRISSMYDRMLVPEELWSMGEELRKRCVVPLQLLAFSSAFEGLMLVGIMQRGRLLWRECWFMCWYRRSCGAWARS